MYQLVIDGIAYRTGSLVALLTEARGCGGARILRTDGTPVVDRAGSDAGPLHYRPRNRQVHRRMTRHAARAWAARYSAARVAA